MTGQPPGESSANRRRLGAALRVAFGAAVLALLVTRSGVGQLRMILRDTSAGFVALAFCFVALGIVASAIRWQVYLRALRCPRPLWYLVRLYTAGYFFNAFLPTGIGGDVYKAIRVRGDGGSVGAGFASVMLDRLSGLVALTVLGAGAALWHLTGDGTNRPALAALALSAAVLGGLGLWLLVRPFVKRRYLSANHTGRIRGVLVALDEGAHHPQAAVWGLVWGFAFQATVVAFHAALLRSLHLHVPLTGLVCVIVVVSIASLLPVTINGLGVREAAYVWSLRQFGIASHSALALALLVFGLLLVTSVLGGIVYALGWAGPHAGLGPRGRDL